MALWILLAGLAALFFYSRFTRADAEWSAHLADIDYQAGLRCVDARSRRAFETSPSGLVLSYLRRANALDYMGCTKLADAYRRRIQVILNSK